MPFIVRQGRRAPVQSTFVFDGSIANGGMNTPSVSVIPETAGKKLSPPFVDFRNVGKPWYSTYITSGFVGSIAAYPPSPPNTRFHAFGASAESARLLPLSCAPPRNTSRPRAESPW